MGIRLGIEPGEGRVLALGSLALALLGWAEISLRNASETLFLKRVGVAHLPGVFLLNDALLLGATFLFVGAASRGDRLRLLPRLLAGSGIALLPLSWIAASDTRSGFVLLLVASRLVPALALVVFWIAMADLLHGRQAKRLFAPITAGGTLGAIAGSFASGPLGHELGIGGLLAVAAGALVLAALPALPLRRLRPRLDRIPRGGGEIRPLAARGTRSAPASFALLWRESGLFRGLAAISLCAAALAPVLYWEFSYLADRATQGAEGEARLLGFYATFRGWIHVGVLLAQLFATSGLFRRIGIPLASAIPPLVYLASFGALAAHASLATGVAALSATRLQDRAVYDPALRVLMNLLPETSRSRASALLEGPVKRLGGVIGNVGVLGALALGSVAALNLAALPIALAWLGASIWLWRRYPGLLLRSAAGRVGREGGEDGGLLDRGTARALAAELSGEDPARTQAAISLLLDAEPAFATEAFAAALERAPRESQGRLIAALDRTLEAQAATPIHSPEAASSLEQLLAAPGDHLPDRERADLVQAYGRLSPRARGVGPLLAALRDPSPAVRLAALAALDRSAAAPPGSDLEAALAAALASDDAALRRTAREECRWSLLAERDEAAFDARLAMLAGLLRGEGERAEVAEAIAEVAARRGARAARVAGAMSALRGDPEPRVRAACLRYVGHAGLAEHTSWLVSHLGSPRAEWSAAARAGLRALGPLAVDALLRELGYGSRRARPDAIAILRELDLGRERLAALYEAELAHAQRDLLHACALGDRERFAMVRQRLVERVDEHLHAALGLLAALHADERIAELGDELRRVRGGRRRSILLEALESLVDRSERDRIVPLLEEGPLDARVRIASGSLGGDVPDLERTVGALLADPEDLARGLAAAVAALDRPSDLRDHRGVKPVEIALQLRSLPIFAGLTTRQLVDLGRIVKEERHAPGSLIAREGAFDDCLYLLLEGVVRVTRGGALLTELGAGRFFGEISVFEGGVRSASVTALSHVRALRLERDDLIALMEDLPGVAIGICQALSRRVRELTKRLEEVTMRPDADSGPAPARGPGPEATAS